MGDVFIGFHADAAASVTLHVCTSKDQSTKPNDPQFVLEVFLLFQHLFISVMSVMM